MENLDFKQILFSGIIGLVIGFFICKQYSPRIETKMETVEKEIVHNNVVTRTVEVQRPDGTKQVETVVTDTSVKALEAQSTSSNNNAIMPKQWQAAVLVNKLELSPNLKAAFQVQRRVLGPFSVILQVNTDAQFYGGLSFEF